MTIPVLINFTLDINPAAWEDKNAVALDSQTRNRIALEVANHAEAMVRDQFYDQGWIKDHHPANDYRHNDCEWCKADE